jgi:hypothetical protein
MCAPAEADSARFSEVLVTSSRCTVRSKRPTPPSPRKPPLATHLHSCPSSKGEKRLSTVSLPVKVPRALESGQRGARVSAYCSEGRAGPGERQGSACTCLCVKLDSVLVRGNVSCTVYSSGRFTSRRREEWKHPHLGGSTEHTTDVILDEAHVRQDANESELLGEACKNRLGDCFGSKEAAGCRHVLPRERLGSSSRRKWIIHEITTGIRIEP